ncbi:MAG: TolC family protein [Xanthomonadales bacterium]|nr:TolC family protein [Xanthomonadales bacterium]MDL1868628.1 TolC family protein [Gammaproteobacteria bacterium PRO6]
MIALHRTLFALLALAPAALSAQAFLPPLELARQAIAAQPEVRAADARVSEARERALALAAGPHDTVLSLAPTRRSVHDAPTPGGRAGYREWEMQLSRAIRLPGKAALDRESGAHAVAAAALLHGDAEHQAARLLLRQWMAWLQAQAASDLAQARAQAIAGERAALARRVELGDAARRELDQLDAELALAGAALREAQAELEAAQLTLAADFTTLPLPPRAPALPAPVALAETGAQWTHRIIERSHEIRAAGELAAQRDALAARARRERLPDPSIDLRSFAERDGMERGIGITLSIPLGNRRRAAEARAESAAAAAAHSELAAMRRDIEREARLDVAHALAAFDLWQAAAAARTATAASVARQRRAWELGEIGLAERLQAERLDAEAALAELRARVAAHASQLRVQVDAHELWHTGDDTAGHAPHDPS